MSGSWITQYIDIKKLPVAEFFENTVYYCYYYFDCHLLSIAADELNYRLAEIVLTTRENPRFEP